MKEGEEDKKEKGEEDGREKLNWKWLNTRTNHDKVLSLLNMIHIRTEWKEHLESDWILDIVKE